jgi:hypothetical protein
MMTGHTSGRTNRRQHLRAAGPFDGHRVGLINMPVQIYDLSVGGCFVNAIHDTTEKGRRLELSLELPDEGAITVKAVTLDSRPEFGYAVQFLDLDPEHEAKLNRVIERLHK